ncbi:MAG: glycerol-3-phosphate acyltransferase 1 [Tepidiforma sp.]|uniref:glycerol-3-phosphate acyltransferase n=1 Tax=Tepidiforma sp. TaxID=2682230 RepID=UPI0021DCC233|nr:glycerol-3-phosphate acyltransferase [Tepidiforma sp.]GIW15030.1 MAG: glycerol-3-phosphate acyltransferase 1 [Tepidiforma sp.]
MRGGWALAGYALGALPFAAWAARLRGADIRAVGDGNPGAANAWKGGGRLAGAAAAVADWAKGAAPVALALRRGTRGPELVAAAVAPVLGHRTSPLLGGRGGKGLAATFGAWTALGGPWSAVTFGGALALGYGVLRLREGWSVAAGAPALLVAALLNRPQRRAESFAAWLLTTASLAWAYRARFGWPPVRER